MLKGEKAKADIRGFSVIARLKKKMKTGVKKYQVGQKARYAPPDIDGKCNELYQEFVN
ncbi:hypothetical protein [Desulfopila aestuarii]|uniref:Uncharacterized protein n=1 Tax=Desulfopila aestuarii DSM 18488 TaxID=1121416 RepID=A0A1M7Y005_9BACT|nr:hypothetical protein [Desulfopila aestuarii]SHO44810.1 hypothetical protein SAMN02745220_00884 [Desulfopila aestuarii DSM 18488]